MQTTTGQAASLPLSGSATMAERIADLEQHLQNLDAALATGQFDPIEQASSRLRRGLSDTAAVFAYFADASPSAALAPDVYRRMAWIRARVSHQHHAVQRAVLTMGRTLSVLLPQDQADTYADLAMGQAARVLQAYR